MLSNTDQDFQKLLSLCAELASEYRDGLIYIGGIAVYLHAINSKNANQYAEATHDADFYISAADMSDMRELEEVQPNRRLSRHQIMRGGFEFDIYTQFQATLRVPYDSVAAHCASYDGIRIASLEHLLILKLDAYAERKASAHGKKDARDLIRIGLVAANQEFDVRECAQFLDADQIGLLKEVARSPEPTVLAGGNAQQAKAIRTTFAGLVERLARA